MSPYSTPDTPASEAPVALDSRALHFASRVLPWLAAGVMLAVYLLTLNHWVSSDSIGLVANLEGISVAPGLQEPVTFALTYPFHWLPAAWVPLALNAFAALCAALSLAFLARTVALLPHDLTRKKKRRRWRQEPPRLLATRRAWLPPVMAVVVCGLQASFWQNAITGTGEMFNLLMFAFIIRAFAEYHAGRDNRWLPAAAFVYGLAVANDWAMAAFFPALVVALIWIKRLFVFNERFLKRLIRHPHSIRWHLLWQIPGCFAAGLAFFLLLPAVASLAATVHLDFLPALKHAVETYKTSLAHFPRTLLVTSALISLMPLMLMGIRFYQFVAGFNRFNVLLGTLFYNLAFAFFLLVCIWTMFDSPLSPRRLNLGAASLPLYFVAALSIGYFTGHFLVVIETIPEPSERRKKSSRMERRRQRRRKIVQWVKRAVLGSLGLAACGTAAALVWKNLPGIALKRSDPCGDYINQLADDLPPEGGVLIGGDQFRLYYLQAALVRDHRQTTCLVLNPDLLVQTPDYLDFLKKSNPDFQLTFDLPNSDEPARRRMIPVMLLRELSRTHDLFCLAPAPVDDPVAEFFYFQPHNLIYQLKPYRADSPFADPTPAGLIQRNTDFWHGFESRRLPQLVEEINPPQPRLTARLSKRFLNTLKFWPEADHDSVIAGGYYSGALNDWGVELQREGKFRAAGQCFAEALELSPQNPAAQINQKFNADYLANREQTIQRPLDTARSLNQYRDWRHVLRSGAVDEPNYCSMLGSFMADNHLLRPAIAQFERVRQLSPNRLDTDVGLGLLFFKCGAFSNVLASAEAILAIDPANQNGLYLEAAAYFGLKRYSEAIPLLTGQIAQDPANSQLRLDRGVAYRRESQPEKARADFNFVILNSTNAYSAYYNLAEMADQETNRAAAVTNYELFLKYAPSSLGDITNAEARLRALQPPAATGGGAQ